MRLPFTLWLYACCQWLQQCTNSLRHILNTPKLISMTLLSQIPYFICLPSWSLINILYHHCLCTHSTLGTWLGGCILTLQILTITPTIHPKLLPIPSMENWIRLQATAHQRMQHSHPNKRCVHCTVVDQLYCANIVSNKVYSLLTLVHTMLFHRQSSREAYLLLQVVWVDHDILLAWSTLAHQIIHHNALILQYNCMVLEWVQDNLWATDQFIGHICLMIRKSGETAAFECAMQEDYS